MPYRTIRTIGFGIAASCCALLAGCSSNEAGPAGPLFTLLDSEQTGVDFQNRIVENEGFNVLEYEYFYNGGGVAVGDIDGDGLPDLYFTANMEPDQLYLNRGDLTFENITVQAGLIQEPSWKAGVTMADANGDGRLDIYVARSGQVSEDRRRNLLYINNGDLTFTERAAEFGLDSPAYSNHASFFDYDRDGDLDMYLLNHPIRRYAHFVVDLMKQQRDSLAGDKLFRNDDGFFVDVSEEAGILGNPLGFGLSATVADVNRDGWPDIYVANDYIEEDYLYINRSDGSFSEESREWLTTVSYSSMGADIADVNNDGLVDIVTLDMLADNHLRQKILKGPEDFAYYEQMRGGGFHDQAMRNMLHLQAGDHSFLEIGRIAGVANTDWSWSALLADFDNDGFNDLIVTNGYMRDYTNLDFLEETLGKAREATVLGQTFSSMEMVGEMPSTRLPNYAFRNTGRLRFEDVSSAWQFDEPSFSNGAAYADLDADGDLDVVINNINQEAFIYRNNASDDRSKRHFLRVALDGPPDNRFGVGAGVTVQTEAGSIFREMSPARGYLSSVDPVLVFGLGDAERADVRVVWPDGQMQIMEGVTANQTMQLHYAESSDAALPEHAGAAPLLSEEDASRILPFVHREDPYNDFEREPLLPRMLSRLGPAVAHADVNRDGLEDLYLGGARGQSGVLYLQQLDGTFRAAANDAFEVHQDREDVGALFFDADGDGDLDLYVTSGGNDAPAGDPIYRDRIYLNNGFGRFVYEEGRLPKIDASTATVAAHDIDGDDDLDLFVGGRVSPGAYPVTPQSYLLENENGFFSDVTAEKAPDLLHAGMIADAAWGDVTGDGVAELLLAGEWMPLTVYQIHPGGGLASAAFDAGLDSTHGSWIIIRLADLDGDGDLDLIAGNQGLNGSLHASRDEPVTLYASDVDANGTMDPIVTQVLKGKRHTIYWRNELVRQIPRWATLFPSQSDYAGATFDDIKRAIPPDAVVLHAYDLETSVFENTGSGRFARVSLPVEAQFAPVNAVIVEDLDGDGHTDLMLAGNNYATRAQWGRDAAGKGLLLSGNGNLSFQALPVDRLGVSFEGDLRNVVLLTRPARRIVAVYNDGPARVFGFRQRVIPAIPDDGS